jgi:hypothetical protein
MHIRTHITYRKLLDRFFVTTKKKEDPVLFTWGSVCTAYLPNLIALSELNDKQKKMAKGMVVTVARTLFGTHTAPSRASWTERSGPHLRA